MTIQIEYIKALERAEKARDHGLIGKLLFRPKEFFVGFFYNKVYFPILRRAGKKSCKTICGDHFIVWLPAGLDIFLLGMKSHDAELRLCRYIINTVRTGTFVDVGAHFGFYTVLASNLLRDVGQVHSIEPSRRTFEVLSENSNDRSNVALHHNVMSNEGPIVFREYDISHSEFNKLVGREGQESEHFDQVNYDEYAIECLTLDALGKEIPDEPIFIKMDVEGAEYEALQGGLSFLENKNITIAMEYHVGKKGIVEGCQKGAKLLFDLDYNAFVINRQGSLEPISGSIDVFLKSKGRDVDNLIFKK